MDSYIETRLRELQLVVFDFDGVFTNNEVIVSEDGTESVICNRSDGWGLRLLDAEKLQVMILSTEINPVVSARAKKLKLECLQGCPEKGKALDEILAKRHLSALNVAYVGNDVNDMPCLTRVGLPVVVNDAFPAAKSAAKWVLTNLGGKGAVREFCEVVYRVRNGIALEQDLWEHYYRKLSGVLNT